MTRPYSNYLFHIPRIGDVVDIVDINELERKMNMRHPPKIVHVIDAQTKKRLGAIPPGIALLKYR